MRPPCCSRCSPAPSTWAGSWPRNWARAYPAIAAITAPYVVDSTTKIAKLVRHPVAMSLFDVLPRETGTVGLAWGITGMRAVFSAKDISGIADLKNMKLRINPTPAYRDFYQLLGPHRLRSRPRRSLTP